MNRRDALVAGLLAAILIAWLIPFARIGVDFHHDGIMLKPALDVLSGQVLFRDTFMQYGALSCYLQVLALWFEPGLVSLRILTAVAYGVTLFFLYASWRLILPRSLTILSCGLFILFIPIYEKNWLNQYWMLFPWSSVLAMMFQSLGLFALFRVIRGEHPERWGMVLGMACACVFWCRQPVGVLMFGSLIAIGLGLRWTDWNPAGPSKRAILVGVLGGFVAVNTLLLGNVIFSGALSEWWYQNFIWPRKWVTDSTSVNSAVFFGYFVRLPAGVGLLILLMAAAAPGLVQRFRPDVSLRAVLIYFLCLAGVVAWQHERVFELLTLREGGWSALFPFVVLLVVVASAALAISHRGQPRTTEFHLVAALAVFSLGSLPQYFPVADPWHVVWSLAPGFGLLAFVFWRWVRWPAPVVALVVAALCLPSLWVKVQTTTRAMARPMVTLANPPVLRGMNVTPEQARTIGRIADVVAEILRHRPDIPSALIGADALYLCFTNNHDNVSPYFVTWTALADNAANQQRWSNILAVRPVLFLHKAKWDAVNDFYRRSNYLPLLYVDEEALEIAVPKELADTMGRTAYGADRAP